MRYVAVLLARSGQYRTALGEHSTQLLKRLVPCVENSPQSQGDWSVGAASVGDFNVSATDPRYGVGFIAHADGSNQSAVYRQGQAVVGLISGRREVDSYLDVDFGVLVTNDEVQVVEGGQLVAAAPTVQNMYIKGFVKTGNMLLQVRADYDGYIEYVADGRVFYRSASRAASPLHVSVGLYNDDIRVSDVHWLDKRRMRHPSYSAIANMSQDNGDLVWDTLAGYAATDAARAAATAGHLRADEKQYFDNMWAANVGASTEESRF
jgi:hypothetical protein